MEARWIDKRWRTCPLVPYGPVMTLPEGYTLARAIPPVVDYLRLRSEAGLTPRDEIAARAGLPNSTLGIVIEHAGEIVGMGRVVGDGALFFQIVDIAVLPAHQGKGLGKAIMAGLVDALARQIPGRAYVSLIADGNARHLYAGYGFVPVAPKSQGMAMWLSPAAD